ncbi:MAG: hypothetical protein IPN47_23810 [Gemmatimonadetes bacterium]|nr:hypothetical protein [Gemmatimonadota bacterium]
MARPRPFATAYSSDARTVDVILNTGALDFPDARLVWPRFLRRRTLLAPDLWIGRHPDREAVMDACEQRGANTLKAIRQFPSHYGCFRTNPPNPTDRYAFDADDRLRTCLQLSRLVRPSSTGYHYAARIIRDQGRRREIIPYGARGLGTYAYDAHEDANWFGDDDVVALRTLLKAFDPTALTARVKGALWYHEYIFWTQMIDVRWPLCITALEALVHTDDKDLPKRSRLGSTVQFVRRLRCLSQYVPELTWTQRDLEEAYDHRSGFVHGVGRGADALTPHRRHLYLTVEAGLRAVIRAAILRPVIDQIFSSRSSIRTTLGF